MRHIRSMPGYALFGEVPASALVMMEDVAQIRKAAEDAIALSHQTRLNEAEKELAVCA